MWRRHNHFFLMEYSLVRMDFPFIWKKLLVLCAPWVRIVPYKMGVHHQDQISIRSKCAFHTLRDCWAVNATGRDWWFKIQISLAGGCVLCWIVLLHSLFLCFFLTIIECIVSDTISWIVKWDGITFHFPHYCQLLSSTVMCIEEIFCWSQWENKIWLQSPIHLNRIEKSVKLGKLNLVYHKLFSRPTDMVMLLAFCSIRWEYFLVVGPADLCTKRQTTEQCPLLHQKGKKPLPKSKPCLVSFGRVGWTFHIVAIQGDGFFFSSASLFLFPSSCVYILKKK